MVRMSNQKLLLDMHEKIGKLVQSDIDQTKRLDRIEDKIDALPCAQREIEFSQHKNDIVAHPLRLFSVLKNMIFNGQSK